MNYKVELTENEMETIIEICELINAFDYIPFLKLNENVEEEINHVWDKFTTIRYINKKFDTKTYGE